MDLHRSDEQEFFLDTIARFLAAEIPLTRVRELAGTSDGFDRDDWRRGAAMGWTSLLVPESDGGGSISGSGHADLAIVADAFGRFVSPGPLLPVNVVAGAVARWGSEGQRAQVLPGLLAGDSTAAWVDGHAIDVPGAGAASPVVTAEVDGGGWLLHGEVAPIEAGAQADLLLVTGADVRGMTAQWLVPAGAEGVTIVPLQSLDSVRRYARVSFDGVRLPAGARLGADDDGGDAATWQRNTALTIQTAEMVGAAERLFAITVDWAFDRYSFGRPLASYQALKHRFADMKTWLEAANALADALAREVSAGDPRAGETASIAKAYAGEHLVALAHDCVQMHGGIGLTSEHDVHLYVRRLTVDRVTHGTPAHHRRLVGTTAA